MWNLALLIDRVVVVATKWPPYVQWMVCPFLYPFVYWRLRGVARALREECRFLPATSWKNVEKHGENVVYARCNKRNLYTKKDEEIGAWTVDYKNKTVRTVTGLPNKYRQTGATF